MSNKKYEFNREELDAISTRIAEVSAKEMALKVSDLDISGNDLIDNFNLSGPQIGKVLNHLLERVVEDPGLNKKFDLLLIAKEYIASTNL